MRITERRLRGIIRQVIRENVQATDKLANFDFDDEGGDKDFIGFARSLDLLVWNFEKGRYDNINDNLLQFNLDFDGLKRLCNEKNPRDSFREDLMGDFAIDKRALNALGFTQNDIDKMLGHNSESSYMYHGSYDYGVPTACFEDGKVYFNAASDY
jgi:hypothetical protein